MAALTRQSPLSKLTPKTLNLLCQVLNMDDHWRGLARKVRFRRTNQPKFTQDFEFCQLERSENPAKAVIRSLYPDNRSIGYLLDLLQELEHYRAAKLLCDVIGESPVVAPPVSTFCTEDLPTPTLETTQEIEERAVAEGYISRICQKNPPPLPYRIDYQANVTSGQNELNYHERMGVQNLSSPVTNKTANSQGEPHAHVNSRQNEYLVQHPSQQNSQNPPDIIIKSGQLNCVSYEQLKMVSKNFCERIGDGGFGQVFYGKTQDCMELAIKRLYNDKDITRDKFRNEVDIQANCDHHNIAPVYAVCDDGQNMCIIYPYMKHGTLRTNLASQSPIRAGKRFTVAKGTAAAMRYLHSFGSKPLLHLDITSANILLDHNFEPKLSDFGQVRYGPALDSPDKTTTYCLNKIGTHGYMPWEFISRGQTSVKTDIYCFGVVLMEILTGLKHYDQLREDEEEILTVYLENHCKDIKDMLDSRAGQWNIDDARSMFEVANSCCNHFKDHRPRITEVWDIIQKWKEVDMEIWV